MSTSAPFCGTFAEEVGRRCICCSSFTCTSTCLGCRCSVTMSSGCGSLQPGMSRLARRGLDHVCLGRVALEHLLPWARMFQCRSEWSHVQGWMRPTVPDRPSNHLPLRMPLEQSIGSCSDLAFDGSVIEDIMRRLCDQDLTSRRLQARAIVSSLASSHHN